MGLKAELFFRRLQGSLFFKLLDAILTELRFANLFTHIPLFDAPAYADQAASGAGDFSLHAE